MTLSVLEVLLQGQVSFREFETKLFHVAMEFVGEILQQVLEELDDKVFESRDPERFRVRQKASKQVDALVGTVTVKRRLYRDTFAGKNVYLLDEVLGLEQRQRVSPGLFEILAQLGLGGPSYRAAANQLKAVLGKRLASHETIRQKVNQAGERLARQQEAEAALASGCRRPGVLFLEVDGMYVSLQREKQSRTEVQVVTAHEGWILRHPGGKEYQLVNPRHFTFQGSADEGWEQIFSHLSAHYDLEETMVVINGDRAPWIRRGVEWFPRAIYQVDRFHLKREVKSLLRNQKERSKEATRAFDENDAGRLLFELAEGLEQEKDFRLRRELKKLLPALSSLEQSMRDYRVRLVEMGYDVSGYRGLGSAESQVDRYARRVKNRGQSWRHAGVQAVMMSLSALFDGKFLRAIRALEPQEFTASQQELRVAIGPVKECIVSSIEEAWSRPVPVLGMGRNRSGGLSHRFRRLREAPTSI